MRDIYIEPDALARLSAGRVEKVAAACARLGLVAGRDDVMAPSSAQAAKLIHAIGRELWDIVGPELAPGERSARVWLPVSTELPWELTAPPLGEPWGLDRHGHVVYQSGDVAPRAASDHDGPSRVVAVSCMPEGLPSVNVDGQRLAASRVLSGLPPACKPQLDWLESPPVEMLRNVIGESTGLLHVIAHGRPGEVLWHENGRPRWVAADDFTDQLAGLDVPLVSLCICDSALGTASGMPSLAASAVRRFARSAVGMRGLLADVAGIAYLRGLLSGLDADDVSVDRMVAAARREIASGGRSIEWIRPALFIRNAVPRFIVSSDVRARVVSAPATKVLSFAIDDRCVAFNKRVLTLGRSLSADVQIRDASVAPFAAVVDAAGEDVEIRDQTGEGLAVNGETVRRGVLEPGDRISLGSAMIVFQDLSVV